MSRWFPLLVVGLLLLACEPRRGEVLHIATKPRPVEGEPSSRSALWTRAEGRFQRELAEKPRQAYERCPDETLPQRQGDLNSLLVRLRDDRADRKNIIPFDLLQTLAPDPFARLREGSGDSATDKALQSLAERRFLAEIVVRAFAPPTHFRRLNAIHSEWSGGRLEAELVVYDLETEHVLCSAPVRVRGDASGAPLSRRLRESTRVDLERKLYARALREVGVALSSISRLLSWPEPAMAISRND